jgi:hypothetical protein
MQTPQQSAHFVMYCAQGLKYGIVGAGIIVKRTTARQVEKGGVKKSGKGESKEQSLFQDHFKTLERHTQSYYE